MAPRGEDDTSPMTKRRTKVAFPTHIASKFVANEKLANSKRRRSCLALHCAP
jgi:hypothetical protein